MQTPILGGSYVARSIHAASNRMVNLFPETILEGGNQAGFLSRAPGLNALTVVGDGPIRGAWTFGDYGYVVSGTELWRITSSWGAVMLGNVVLSSDVVSMSDNGKQLFVACGAHGYIYNVVTNTFAEITDVDFPGATTVAYLDGYFVFNQPDSQLVWVTALLNGLAIDPLDFASAEGFTDDLLAIIVDHREAWLFGSKSIEVWYDAGASGFPLAKIQGATMEVGIASSYCASKIDNSIMWLANDGIVYRANGYTQQRVSTHAVESWISQTSDLSNAQSYSYRQEGHQFYILIFPSATTTFVYDVATGMWHERSHFADGIFKRHRGNCCMYFNETNVVGDYETGRVYAYDFDKYSEGLSVQKWLRSWRALPTGVNNLKRQTHHSLQLDIESGVGLNQNQGVDPQIMLRFSNDAGKTWSSELWRTMGKIGETGKRVIWRRLGLTEKLRDRVYEISGTDAVKVIISGAELSVEAAHD